MFKQRLNQFNACFKTAVTQRIKEGRRDTAILLMLKSRQKMSGESWQQYSDSLWTEEKLWQAQDPKDYNSNNNTVIVKPVLKYLLCTH